MSLIAMAVYDTNENKRTEITRATLNSLISTVNFHKHRLIIVDNNSCDDTIELYNEFPFEVISLPENVGTAKAINEAWRQRLPGEHCIKIDNDVVINHRGWVDEMEEAIKLEPLIGQIGLKRKDCWETPTHDNPDFRSKIVMLPHEAGQPWLIIEVAKHIIGTCVMHSSALLDKVGYLYQPTRYGYDDVLMSWRANLAGFVTCFLPHINIDHIDPGDTPYQKKKEDEAAGSAKLVSDLVDEFIAGKSLYYD